MMEAARTSETSVDNHFTRQYNPEDNSEHHTRRRENLKSHKLIFVTVKCCVFFEIRTGFLINLLLDLLPLQTVKYKFQK
jgi:hypothetical protein